MGESDETKEAERINSLRRDYDFLKGYLLRDQRPEIVLMTYRALDRLYEAAILNPGTASKDQTGENTQ